MPNAWVSNGVVNSRYDFSYTADQSGDISVILNTQNTFVDKNILVKASVPAGSLSKGAGSVAINVENAALLGSSANSAPSTGPYLKITGSGTVSVGTGGWLSKNTSLSSNEQNVYYPIKIATFDVSDNVVYCVTGGYVPTGSSTTPVGTIASVTPTTTASYSDDMSTYFNTGTVNDNDVTITPQYKNSAGYVAAHSSWTNNGGISYWKIKTTTMTTTSTAMSNGEISRYASASWGTGWISTGSITAATFSNAVATGKTASNYTDISAAAPIIPSGGYLYINAGYTSDVRISLAQLVPNEASINIVSNTSADILSGKTAYDSEGKLITGTIPSLIAQTYTPGTSDQTIAAGQYLSGVQTIVGDADLAAGNIKTGVTIFGVTGTFTNTPSGKTALTAAALRSGYAGFINGTAVNGSMPDATFTNNASSLTATNNATAPSSDTPTLPFSIYTSTDKHGITIVTATTTGIMGENKVFIQLNSSGSVKCTSDPGGYVAKNATAACTSLTRYIAMNYYQGGYTAV